jgi:class 3 adenylate cyclase
VGLHTAEIARSGAQIWGDGVGIALEAARQAPPGEVWVTATVRDLTAGSGRSYERRGSIEPSSLGRPLELDAVN